MYISQDPNPFPQIRLLVAFPEKETDSQQDRKEEEARFRVSNLAGTE